MVFIRHLLSSDIESFQRALDAVAQERKFLTFTKAPSIELLRNSVRLSLARGEPRLVAIDDHVVVGWCHVAALRFNSMDHGATLALGLLPGYRRRGIGKLLLLETISAAKARGIAYIEMGVFSHNHAAIKLYKRVGFIEQLGTERAVQVGGERFDEITMTLRL